ncbi:MAG: [Fe-Fe] hydrogenase large subunit C-terminal domain-containing protein [Anaeromyxobacteraceae bacterium]
METGVSDRRAGARDAEPALVFTAGDRCRLCFTCLRECPAKAIQVKGGQAAVVSERCVACGHCVRVCSQGAKQYRRDVDEVRALLASGARAAICLSPVFPVEFDDVPEPRLLGRLRALGFAFVVDAGFGNDLVARAYRELLSPEGGGRRRIATTCPAMVGYVERFHPALVPALAPVVSPMVAIARWLRAEHGEDLQVVYAGPCVAKKAERRAPDVAGDVARVLTFDELRELLRGAPGDAPDGGFDGPAGFGAPLKVQLGRPGARPRPPHAVVSADGRLRAYEAVEEAASGAVEAELLHLLSCRGCVEGPGCTTRAPHFARVGALSRHARERLTRFDEPAWTRRLDAAEALPLDRTFAARDVRQRAPKDAVLDGILARLGKARPQDELNCGACGYETCRGLARAIHAGLAEPDMCLPSSVEHLRAALSDLADANQRLASTQDALAHAERLANLGQLAAGVAHELNNPLGVILVYAHLLLDACPPERPDRPDLALIAEHADRCRRIVSGLLDFARQNKLVVQAVDLPRLVANALRAAPPPAGIEVVTAHAGDPVAALDRDQLAQVLANLVGNAYDAMPEGGRLTVRTSGDADRVRIEVEDTGTGIQPEHLGRVFEPFFSTKPIGRGTGLGLAVCYGIVKVHRGELAVRSNADPARGPRGTTFSVVLPRRVEASP